MKVSVLLGRRCQIEIVYGSETDSSHAVYDVFICDVTSSILRGKYEESAENAAGPIE